MTIDELQLEISSNADQSTKGIDALTASLARLKSATNISSNLTKLSTTLSALDDISKKLKGPDEAINKWSEVLQKFGEVNGTGVGKIIGSLEKIPDVVQKINEIDSGAFESAISRINTVLGSFTSELGKVTTGIDSMSPKFGEASQSAQEFTATMQAINTDSASQAVTELGRTIGDIAPQTQTASNASRSSIQGIGTSANTTASTITSGFQKIVGAVSSVGEGIRSTFSFAFNAARSSAMGFVSILNSALSAARTVSSALVSGFQKAAGAISAAIHPINSLKKALGIAETQARGFQAQILGAFKRILMYRILRSIIAGIGTAFKEGVKNIAAFDSSVKASMSSIITDILYLKNALATAAAPIITTLAPAFRMLTDVIVQAVNAIAMFMAAITGQTSYTRAIRANQAYGDSLSGAAGAAKELKDATAGFDELNVIPQPTTGGGGGGGGAGADIGSMFETAELESSVTDFISALTGPLDELYDYFYEWGTNIGQGINNALNNIDWNKIKDWGVRLATMVSASLNGIVDSVDWGLLGSSFGEAINTILLTGYTFMTTFNWSNFGTAIITGINSAIATIDWKLAGSYFASKWNAFIDTMYSIVTGADWSKIGTAIATAVNAFFSGIKWDKASSIVSGGINGVVETLRTTFTGTNWTQMALDFTRSIKNAISNINWKGIGSALALVINSAFNILYIFVSGFDWTGFGTAIADAVNTWFADIEWDKAGQTISDGVKGILQLINTAITETDWKAIGEDIKKFLANIDWNGIVVSFGNLIINAFNSGILDTVLSVAIGTALLRGNLKTGGALLAIEGIVEILRAIKNMLDVGINWDDAMSAIQGLTDVAIGIGLFTGNVKWIGWGLIIKGFTTVINELKNNWDAIKQGDWSGVDKVSLIIGGLEILGGVVTALDLFSKIKGIATVGKAAGTVTTVSDAVGGLSPTLLSLVKNLGLGLAAIGEVAIGAILFTAAIWVLGIELEQVGIAWKPVIENGDTIKKAIGLGTAMLAAIGVATGLLGSVGGTPLIVNIALGTAILAELGIATGLFITEIWGIGKGLDKIGQAWQPVMDNGDTIKEAILIGTGLLVGIGTVAAALGVATVASAGLLPVAIGIGTALLVEMAAACILFTASIASVANELSDNLAPALSKINVKLPKLATNMDNFTTYMTTFADNVVTYSQATNIAGLSATISTIISWFTTDPFEKLAKDVDKVYNQSATLNEKFDIVLPELKTAAASLKIYTTRLGEIATAADVEINWPDKMLANIKDGTIKTLQNDVYWMYVALAKLNENFDLALPELKTAPTSLKTYTAQLGKIATAADVEINWPEIMLDNVKPDTIKTLAAQVKSIQAETKTLNDKLTSAIPEMETAVGLLTSYTGFLNKMDALTGSASGTSLSSGIFINLKEVGQKLITGFVDGIKSKSSDFNNATKTLMTDFEKNINSDSSNVTKAFNTLMSDSLKIITAFQTDGAKAFTILMKNIASSVQKDSSTLERAFSAVMTNVTNTIDNSTSSIIQSINNMMRDMANSVKNNANSFETAFKTMTTNVSTAFTTFANKTVTESGAMVRDIGNAVKNNSSSVETAFTTMTTNALKVINTFATDGAKAFTTMTTNALKVINTFATDGAKTFTTMMTDAKNNVSGANATSLNAALTTTTGNALKVINTFATDGAKTFTTMMTDAKNNVGGANATSLNAALTTTINTLLKTLDAFSTDGVKEIKNFMTDASTAVKNDTTMVSAFKTMLNKTTTQIQKFANNALTAFKNLVNSIAKLMKAINMTITVPSVPTIQIQALAKGGIVDDGQLFVAREAGPEFVGSIGRRTAVANNDQIVDGIVEGVYTAVTSAMNAQSSNERNAEYKFYMDGKEIVTRVEKIQRERGTTIMPGGAVFGT